MRGKSGTIGCREQSPAGLTTSEMGRNAWLRRQRFAAPDRQCYRAAKQGSLRMKLARVAAAALALLAMPTSTFLVRPAHAQMPHINMLPDDPSKTPEQKEADQER